MDFFKDICSILLGTQKKVAKKEPPFNKESLRTIIGDERYERQKRIDELREKYKDINDKCFYISTQLENNKIYSKAINQPSLLNKYTEEYIKLCEEYITLLPEKTMYERKRDEIDGFGNTTGCHRLLKQYILLLDKLQDYERESEVIGFLIGLGLTDDGTKGGLEAKREKLRGKIVQSRTNEKWFKEHSEYFNK